jgi:hypothetical protein
MSNSEVANSFVWESFYITTWIRGWLGILLLHCTVDWLFYINVQLFTNINVCIIQDLKVNVCVEVNHCTNECHPVMFYLARPRKDLLAVIAYYTLWIQVPPRVYGHSILSLKNTRTVTHKQVSLFPRQKATRWTIWSQTALFVKCLSSPTLQVSGIGHV